ncbi:MAG: EamA family transporter, partial [Cyanobacteria bacterium REEB65]|nr:EamA family transporter [Cyanobacteria bacterium REEB65]
MKRRPAIPLAVWAALGVVYLGWGSTYLAIRIADQSIPALVMAGGRFILAGILMVALGAALRNPWPTARQWGISAILGTMMLGAGNGGVIWAEQYLPSGMVSLLVAPLPL